MQLREHSKLLERIQNEYAKQPRLVVLCGVLLVCALVAGIVGAGLLQDNRVVITHSQEYGSLGNAGTGSAEVATADELVPIVVDVGGAVVSPGVVELEQEARVADAIAAAGGLATDANTDNLNQAAKLSDGQKIYVPRIGENDLDTTTSEGSSSTAATSSSAHTTTLVNINTATLEELDTLPGVGASTAQAIIDEREHNGAFVSVEDIMRVSGIGEKKYAKLKDAICV